MEVVCLVEEEVSSVEVGVAKVARSVEVVEEVHVADLMEVVEMAMVAEKAEVVMEMEVRNATVIYHHFDRPGQNSR